MVLPKAILAIVLVLGLGVDGAFAVANGTLLVYNRPERVLWEDSVEIGVGVGL